MGTKARKTTKSITSLGTIENVYIESRRIAKQGIREVIIFEIRLKDGSILREIYSFCLNRSNKLYPILEAFFTNVHEDIELYLDLLVGTEWYFDLQPLRSDPKRLSIKKVYPTKESFEFDDTLNGLVMEVCGDLYSIQNPTEIMLPI